MINWDKIKYFKASEFDSGTPRGEKLAGSGENMNEDFLIKLDTLRRLYGKPIIITSGYRTKAYNEFMGFTQTHATGRAVDIAVSGKDCYNIMALAHIVGFTGVGFKQHGSNRFMHLDDLEGTPQRPRPFVWSYK